MKNFRIFFAAALITAAFTMSGACNNALNTDLVTAESGRDIASGKSGGVGTINSWTQIGTLPSFGSSVTTLEGIASNGNSDFVIIAGYNATSPAVGAAYTAYSYNSGGTWSGPTTLSGFPRSPSAISYLAGINYLVTAANQYSLGAYSSNGTSWLQTQNIGFGTKAQVYGEDAIGKSWYLVGGQLGQAAYAAGLGTAFTTISSTYTTFSGSSSAAYINAAAYGSDNSGGVPATSNPVFVFGGGSGRIAWTNSIVNISTGVPYTWNASNSQSIFTSTGFVNVIVCGLDEDGLDVFVAAGQDGSTPPNGKIAYSTDGGLTWTASSISGTGLGSGVGIYALAAGEVNGVTYFVAGDDAGYIAYSTDGKNWRSTTASGTPAPVFTSGGHINGLAFGLTSGSTGRFIAVGGTSGPEAYYADVP